MLDWKAFADTKPELYEFLTTQEYIVEYNKWRYKARRLALISMLGNKCVNM